MRSTLAVFIAFLTIALSTGCANFIREEPAVIWDTVPETEQLRVDDLDIEGATAQVKLRYTSLRQMYSIVNIRETPYSASNELYEVPVGLVTIPFTFTWYVVTELLTLGSADATGSVGPLNWSAAGLNPFLPVEGGMFTRIERVREKKKARTAQDDSAREPYEALVSVDDGEVELRFIEPSGDTGEWITQVVGEELVLDVDLLQASVGMPSPTAQRVELMATVQPDTKKDAFEKSVTFDIPGSLARRLYEARDWIEKALRQEDRNEEEAESVENERRAAIEKLEEMGFEREAAKLRYRN